MSQKLPNEEQIQVRAYEIYLNRGCEDGHALEHWLAAETELTAQGGSVSAQSETPADASQPRSSVTAAGHSK